MVIQVIVNGLVVGLIYALTALGFNLIYNATRIFHITHGAIYTSAAYFYILFSGLFGNPDSFLLQVLTSILSIILAALLGITSEIVIYRKLRKSNAPFLVYFIASLGFYILIINSIVLAFGNETHVLKDGLSASVLVGKVILTKIQIVQFFISIFVLSGVIYFLLRTIIGKVVRAMFDNYTLVQILGYNVNRYRIFIVFIGSLLAGVGSILSGIDLGTDPQIGLSVFLTSAVAMIIGGVNSFYGTILAAILLGIIQNLAVWFFSSQWQDAITFLVLIIVLVIKREGLVEIKLRLEEE